MPVDPNDLKSAYKKLKNLEMKYPDQYNEFGQFIRENQSAGYKNEIDNKNVIWNRLTCEPSVRYGDKNGSICKPDLVIWAESIFI